MRIETQMHSVSINPELGHLFFAFNAAWMRARGWAIRARLELACLDVGARIMGPSSDHG